MATEKNNNLNEFVKLGAAWVRHDNSGRVFLSTDLHFAGRKVILFKNRFKRAGSQEPDFQLFLAPLSEDKRTQGREFEDTGAERYDDDLGDIPAGAGEPQGDYLENGAYQPIPDESLAPPPPRRPTHPATEQARRAYQPQQARNVPGGTNAALGGRGEATRRNAAQPAGGEEELTDPFAE